MATVQMRYLGEGQLCEEPITGSKRVWDYGQTQSLDSAVAARLMTTGLFEQNGPVPVMAATNLTGGLEISAGGQVRALPPVSGLSLFAAIEEVIFDQGPDGRFVFTQNDTTYGDYLQQISIASGDLGGALTKTAIVASDGPGLKTVDGSASIGGGSLTRDAWWVSPTRIVFRSSGIGAYASKHFLYLANYNGSAWTVGNNAPAFDNKQAVVALGAHAGGQESGTGGLHHRALATKGSTLLFGEYGTPIENTSGTADQMRVLQSTDGGATWSALLTWNTAIGSHQVRHVHAIIYDKYRDTYLICIGDAPYSCVIEWDGSSAAPPANTQPSDFWQFAGWNVYKHSPNGRTGDVTIHADRRYYLTDNSEVDTAESPAVRLSTSDPLIAQKVCDYPRSDGRPALIQCEMPYGAALWASMSESSDIGGDGYRAFDFIYSPDGMSFHKVAKTRLTGTPGSLAGTLVNIAVLKRGGSPRVFISGVSYSGSRLLPGNKSGTLVCDVVPWDGTQQVLNAVA